MIGLGNFLRLSAVALLFGCVSFAADLAGIWMGESPGRNGEKQDISFRFQIAKGVLTGVMFGDEFDLPVQDLHVDGDRVSFSVTNINFYNGQRTKTLFTGSVSDTSLELIREQAALENAATPAKPRESKQTLKLRRLK